MNLLPVLDNSYAVQAAPFKLVSFVIVLGLLLIAMGTYRSPAVALMPDVTAKPLRSKANAAHDFGHVGGKPGGDTVVAHVPQGDGGQEKAQAPLHRGGELFAAASVVLG